MIDAIFELKSIIQRYHLSDVWIKVNTSFLFFIIHIYEEMSVETQSAQSDGGFFLFKLKERGKKLFRTTHRTASSDVENSLEI